ncbi:MAG: helix-turn-helix domain-containing protein [Burkholderiales bacterium]|nr:helix-turn-helix domain-containing protein [Burkholderiales bacterium]
MLHIVQRLGVASAGAIHRECGLPKPTLTRLLRTLEAKGFVWRSIADGMFRPSYQSHGAVAMPAAGYRLAAVAGPVLDALCAKVHWPSDVSVRNRTFMQLCESSRTRAYFTLNRLQIGFQISMLQSAPGRAYLAWCPEKERAEILRRLAMGAKPGSDMLRQPARLAQVLSQTREQGYALRDPDWGGGFGKSKGEYDDGLNAIALPILSGRKVLGCVNIVWIARLFGPDRIVRDHISSLRAAAEELSVLAATARAI